MNDINIVATYTYPKTHSSEKNCKTFIKKILNVAELVDFKSFVVKQIMYKLSRE